MKKKILAICIMLMTCAAFVSCRENTEETEDPLIRETEIGVNLENKAKDAVETQGEQAGESDAMLDEVPTD